VEFGFVESAEEGEEEGMIENKDVGGEGASAHFLVEAAGVFPAGFWGAEVAFATDLGPDLRVGSFAKIAQGAIAGGKTPFAEAFELDLFGGGEEAFLLSEGTLETGGAEVILSTFEQGGLESHRQDFLHQGDVLVDELFLEVDGVGADEGLAFLGDGMEGCGDEVGEGFADSGAGFDHEGALFLEGSGDGNSHGLLFGPIFKTGGAGKFAMGREEVLDRLAEGAGWIIRVGGIGVGVKRNHAGAGVDRAGWPL
jgi:hypothetical protein